MTVGRSCNTMQQVVSKNADCLAFSIGCCLLKTASLCSSYLRVLILIWCVCFFSFGRGESEITRQKRELVFHPLPGSFGNAPVQSPHGNPLRFLSVSSRVRVARKMISGHQLEHVFHHGDSGIVLSFLLQAVLWF